MKKEKGAHLVCDIHFFLNRVRELGCLRRSSLVEALAFPGSCMSNMADAD